MIVSKFSPLPPCSGTAFSQCYNNLWNANRKISFSQLNPLFSQEKRRNVYWTSPSLVSDLLIAQFIKSPGANSLPHKMFLTNQQKIKNKKKIHRTSDRLTMAESNIHTKRWPKEILFCVGADRLACLCCIQHNLKAAAVLPWENRKLSPLPQGEPQHSQT